MSGNSWRNGSTSAPTDPISEGKLPVVAIVGKPNVGKSTLFNRFLKKRRAITHSLPGITRDPLRNHWVVKNRETILVDTGGIRPLEEKQGFEIDTRVQERSLRTIEEADCVLLVTSVEGITAEDEELFDLLRPHAHKVILVVNKVDTEEREAQLGEFYGIGFGEPVAVSAAHGRYCEVLADRVFDFLERRGKWGPSLKGEPKKGDPCLSIAVLGKPNTGKSTLVNHLLGKEVSLVSPIPGTTRDVIEGQFFFEGKAFRVLDTAGIRRKTKVREDVEYFSVHRALERIRDADVVFLLIDAQEGLTEQDKKIAAQVVKKGKGIIMVVNKWDTVEGGKKAFAQMEDRIRFQFPVLEFAPIVPISAKTGWNVEALLKECFTLKKQLHTRIETSELNRSLERWVASNPPPQDGKRRFKVRYITQVKVAPVRFILFVNRKEGFPRSYVGYIKNRIREEYSLSSIPVDVDVRSRSSSP